MRIRKYLKAILSRLNHPWILGPVIGFGVMVLVGIGYLETLEAKLFDQYLRWRGPIAHRRDVVVVAVSETTFTELERPWPFRRALYAEAIEKIQAAKPKAIGMDILFAEDSVFGSEDDEVFAATLRKYDNVVLGALSVEQEDERVYTGSGVISLGIKAPKFPIKPLQVAPFGFVNLLHEVDGFVRQAPLSMSFQKERFETLAGQLVKLATRDGVRVRPPAGRQILINFRGGEGAFETVGFHQVIRNEFDRVVFAGKIVLIGASSKILHDVFNTPFAPRDPMPGVEIQANVLDNLLRGDPLRPAGKGIPLLLAIVATVLATFVTARFSPLKSALVVAAVGLAYALICFGSLTWYRLWVEQLPVQLALFGPYAAVVVRNYVMEERAKRRLSRFFSPAVVQDILKHENVLGSQRRKITILFSDIRNFTTISEKLPPETVVEALRYYFNTMTPIIFKNGGSVDKFVGDAIMAFFNAPTEDPNHADSAVKAGIEMIRAVESLSPHWEKMTGYPLRIGVGINTGEPVIGTMGSDDRLEYSCIGDAVNLAARLESATKEFKRDILISEYTVRELKGRYPMRPVQEIQVKGREQAVQVYSVDTGTGPAGDEAELRTLVDATLQTISTTRAPLLTRHG